MLGILHFRCRKCGALIAGDEKTFVERIEFPQDPNGIDDERLLPKDIYNEIQAGLRTDPLIRFKGLSYSECIAERRKEYTRHREKVIEKLRAQADQKEKEYKNRAKSTIRKEDKSGIVLEVERWDPIVEGDGKKGIVKCPKCGYILISWAK